MDLDRIVLESLAAWGVPGAAVVVVRDGTVSHLAGYGVADAFTGRPVTPDTVFAIASCTKAFAATACAVLVEDGRLGWDDLVRRYLPHFRMGAPLADAEVTIRDLLCHRTGLGRHDLLWVRVPWDFDESVRRLAFLELSAPFRSRYDYNNLLYIVVGQVISAAAGKPWHEFVRQRLFGPLGMTRSVFTTAETRAMEDVASPHRLRHGRLQLVPGADDTKVRASGSIKSCARDLGAWLLFQISGGLGPDGTPVLTVRHLAETHTPQMVHRPPVELARRANTTLSSYGLGWHVLDYRGHLLLEHSGGLGGFCAHVAFLPRQRSGLAVVANLRHTDMACAVSRRLLDALLGLPDDDWDQYYLQQEIESQERASRKVLQREARRHRDTRPSLELTAYAGVYSNPAYGEVVIDAFSAGSPLALRWSTFRVHLEHYHYDTFTTREDDPDVENPLDGLDAFFHLGADGSVTHLHFLGRHFRRRHYGPSPNGDGE